ncbi:hypothetical protein [Chitinophaga ginsengisoli]|uniref:Uncharacterized protein n=1 Tax=Chitinophaga ginsengisoli TaxID=363837 RepID=A0A2P8GKM2_9BACT|nr:hypothetical protein [Chitinophaga ginsengisoli]PSL34518.1 hypothetical protein CLV42_10289 [Chitinophaga ginsengisoli]
MRALLFDAYSQVVKEIVLPAERAIFYQQVKQYLNAEGIDMIHPNKLLTILFDPLAFTKAGTPGFLLGLLEEFPLFGNIICVGRNPITYQIEDLSGEFTRDHFDVSWYAPTEAEEYRKKAMLIGINNYRS